MREITLNIEGMHCDACVRRVTQALERTSGTEVVEARVGAARVRTEDPASAIAAIAKAGYTARAAA
jgi:copper chaperone